MKSPVERKNIAEGENPAVAAVLPAVLPAVGNAAAATTAFLPNCICNNRLLRVGRRLFYLQWLGIKTNFMEKYRISDRFSLDSISRYYHEESPSGKCVLVDQFRDKAYLINDTIRYFLNLFKIPRSYKETILILAGEVNSEPGEVQRVIKPFFKSLLKKGILVDEHATVRRTEPDPYFKENSSVDGYRVLKTIASCRKGEVYKVRDLESRAMYVLKLISPLKTPGMRKFATESLNLKQEYEITRKLGSHPGIIRAIRFHEGTIPYLILEYYKGSDLSQYVKEKLKGASPEIKTDLISRILEAFGHIHSNKIIHGDIHAHNILVGDDGKIRVIDFGLANHYNLEDDQVINNGGVHHFVPPERISLNSFKKFKAGSTFASEVYQLGLLMYLILYGKIPFSGFTWKDLTQSILYQDAPFQFAEGYAVEAIPDLVLDFVKKALSKNPSGRFKNAAEMNQCWNQVITYNYVQ